MITRGIICPSLSRLQLSGARLEVDAIVQLVNLRLPAAESSKGGAALERESSAPAVTYIGTLSFHDPPFGYGAPCPES